MNKETDEELYSRLKRWGGLTSKEIQKEVLQPKYESDGWPRVFRVAESACVKCGSNERKPCNLTQYLETCLGCGRRIGDTPKGI
jgi:hypothetical protein